MRSTPINRLDRAWSNAQTNSGDSPTNLQIEVRSWESDFERFLANHSHVALAAAAVAGVLLGWVIKRR